jgi:hypothetical protein
MSEEIDINKLAVEFVNQKSFFQCSISLNREQRSFTC